ncbi:MAG: GNAT family N-acetyltransferase [Firmicutes bacterium]|nr:GNAT family N-acetyltransferase [Bacillota bacterium]
MIQLQTERLCIRDYTSDDFNSYFALYSNKKVVYYYPDGYLKTIDEAKKQFDDVLNEIDKAGRQNYYLCVRGRKDDSYIGEIGYSTIENTPLGKLVGVGYFLLPAYWANGYATEAFQAVMRFAFEDDQVFRMKAGCLKENVGSEKVMIKCGMIKEADFKCSTLHDGQMKDSVAYRLLKSEWKSQHK